jgi:predicted transcriptional regulator
MPASRDHATRTDPLGPLERRVMEVVWVRGPATPREVAEALNTDTPVALAYTTVMTILVRLADKGFLERFRSGRGYTYRASVERDGVERVAGKRELDRLLRRYGPDTVAAFAADLLPGDHELVARLRSLADGDPRP